MGVILLWALFWSNKKSNKGNHSILKTAFIYAIGNNVTPRTWNDRSSFKWPSAKLYKGIFSSSLLYRNQKKIR